METKLIITENQYKMLLEYGDEPYSQYLLGRAAARAGNRGDLKKQIEIRKYRNEKVEGAKNKEKPTRKEKKLADQGYEAFRSGEYDQIYHEGNKKAYSRDSEQGKYTPHPEHKFKTKDDFNKKKKVIKEWSHERPIDRMNEYPNKLKWILYEALRDTYGGEITEEQQEWWENTVEEEVCERVLEVIDESLNEFEEVFENDLDEDDFDFEDEDDCDFE